MQGPSQEAKESAALLVGQRITLRGHFSKCYAVVDPRPTFSVLQALRIPGQSAEVMSAARNGCVVTAEALALDKRGDTFFLFSAQ